MMEELIQLRKTAEKKIQSDVGFQLETEHLSLTSSDRHLLKVKKQDLFCLPGFFFGLERTCADLSGLVRTCTDLYRLV